MPSAIEPMKLLDTMYNAAASESDKGERFERFVQSFLQTDPTWACQFSHVWMWNDWPENSSHDIGIDLVAERRDGGLAAVQCKFYDPRHYIAKADIDSVLATSGRTGFTERLIVSTTTQWGPNAEQAIRDQAVPVRRLGLEDEDRGRMIMACGTGKTFTSLRLAEEMVGSAGTVLFLVPSIALLSQALREWSNQSALGFTAMSVCSDAKASKGRKKKDDDLQDVSTVDLALPATTDPETLATRMRSARTDGEGMRVVFATYQSIDVVAQAQKLAGLEPFDLIVCDEAHRTTGVTIADAEESAFVRVHDTDYLRGSKRLYMTATPRIYDDASKAKAGRAQAVLASMDDEDVEPYSLDVIGGKQPPMDGEEDYYRVTKMRFPAGKKAADRPDSLVINPHITMTGIPEEAYSYQLGSRPAIKWIFRQYQATTDKASGITNDPNQWGIEHGKPRYTLDLLQKVVTVSVGTADITGTLPSLEG